jgi:hypothetical protein
MTDPPIEGVPHWARASLSAWLVPIIGSFSKRTGIKSRTGGESPEFLMIVERRLRVSLDWTKGYAEALESLGQVISDGSMLLQLLELALEHIDLGYSVQEEDAAIAALDRILTESGMVWRVDVQDIPTGETWHGHQAFRKLRTLQRRTTPEAATAVQTLNRNAPSVAQHMTSAWNYAFGRNPNPGHAYSEAIKAVEAAAIPVVSPKDTTATLGKVIGGMRASPRRWRCELADGSHGASSIEIIIAMMDLLWVNQTDRHAPVQPVTQAQAETAIHLALTLVQFFSRSITTVK